MIRLIATQSIASLAAARVTARARMARLAAVAALVAAAAAPSAEAADSRDLRHYGPSTLLSRGESELKLFNNLYTQTDFFNDSGDRTDQGARSTYYTGTASLRVGWTPRANFGVDATVRAVKDETRRPAFDTRRGLTSVTPKVQFVPFPSRGTLTVQTGIRIPLGSELEGNAKEPFLDFADPAAIAQVLYDVSLSPDFRLYLEGGGFVRMAGDDSQVTTPLKAILNWEPSAVWSLYVPTELAPDWLGDSGGNYYSQVGLGGKLRPGDGTTEIELLWTTFPFGKNSGAGQTFNLGIRFLR